MKPYNIHPMCRIVEDTSDPVFKPYFQDVHKCCSGKSLLNVGRGEGSDLECWGGGAVDRSQSVTLMSQV